MPAVKKVAGAKTATTIPAQDYNVDVQLPDQDSKPSNRFEDFTFLIYGERKIGKTSLFSQFNDVLFCMFEPGGRALQTRQVYLPSWRHFLSIIGKLEKNPGYCKNVVIDTGHMAYERCFEYCLDIMGITDPRDKSWGAGWKFIDREFRAAHSRLFALGLGFGVTAHSDIKEVQDRDGNKFDKIVAQLGNQAFRFYGAVVDVIAYYQYNQKKERVLTIRGDSLVEAGSRLKGHFLYADTQRPIEHIPMGNSEEEAYSNLVKGFNNQLVEGGQPAKRVLVKKRPV